MFSWLISLEARRPRVKWVRIFKRDLDIRHRRAASINFPSWPGCEGEGDAMETNNPGPDIVSALLAATGLRVSYEELVTLRALYARFATERANMASIDVGTAEPATTFAAEPPADDER